MPVLISENSRRCGPVHRNPLALGSQSLASPPSTGTAQVSQLLGMRTTVYATREPSGEKTGIIFTVESCVSCTGSPPDSRFT
jgi:hypothetical protein